MPGNHLHVLVLGELIGWDSRSRPVSLPFCVSTFSNMNISETSGQIAIKFYLKHHWGRGKTIQCFGPDRIRTLVSMATSSSHKVIMGETL